MRLSVFLLCVLVSACAVQPTAPPRPDYLFNDAAFRPRAIPADINVFAPSAAMKHFLYEDIASPMRRMGHLDGLIDALQNRAQLKLEYDSAVTRTAAEAFDARAGNCISLVIMTAALAKELGLLVYYQQVHSEQTWSRDGDIAFRSGHVNLILRPFPGIRGLIRESSKEMIVDFLPPEEVRGYQATEITERTVVAMFMNNRAAEALVRGQLDDAYWWAREAILRDSGFLEAYNTLGVIYRRHGNMNEAERIYRLLLERDRENPTVLANLAAVLGSTGRTDEAQALLRRLNRVEPYPPFYFMDQAQVALKKGDFNAAIALFSRELARDPDYHAAHFGLAATYFQLRNLAAAREHLAAAKQNSTTPRDHALYAGKLERLRSYQAN